jgi:hypothetical protein
LSNFSLKRSAGSRLPLVRPSASPILPDTALPSVVVTFTSAPKWLSAGNCIVPYPSGARFSFFQS